MSTEHEELKDGIYFNMPFEQYIALDRLSSSRLKAMQISPLQCYMESFGGIYDDTSNVFMDKGSAYHALVLEGSDVFNARFVKKLTTRDYPDALDSQADLKAYCKSIGVAVSGTKPELAARIIEQQPEMREQIMLYLQADFDKTHEGKTVINESDYEEVVRASKILEASHLGDNFKDGYPEVSILWTCPKTSLKCKARIDYLRPDRIVELKTFSNKSRKSVEIAVAQAVAYERYNIGAVHYMNGISALKKVLMHDEYIHMDGTVNDAFICALLEQDQEFIFVFQETGKVNNCLARKFTKTSSMMQNEYWSGTQDLVYNASALYAACLKKYGTEKPWIEPQDTHSFDDSDFPVWMVSN